MFIHSSSFTPIELEAVMVDGRRLYPTPSGKQHPSITTVLGMCPKKKASLAKWRQRVGQEKAQAISTRACTRGTNFHSIVENYLNNCYNAEEHKSSPLPLLMFKNAVPTLNRITKVYLQEAALYSYIQETGYACMFYELYKTRIKQLVTIVACEDGSTQVVIKKPDKEYLDRLIYLRSLYEEKYGG